MGQRTGMVMWTYATVQTAKKSGSNPHCRASEYPFAHVSLMAVSAPPPRAILNQWTQKQQPNLLRGRWFVTP